MVIPVLTIGESDSYLTCTVTRCLQIPLKRNGTSSLYDIRILTFSYYFGGFKRNIFFFTYSAIYLGVSYILISLTLDYNPQNINSLNWSKIWVQFSFFSIQILIFFNRKFDTSRKRLGSSAERTRFCSF